MTKQIVFNYKFLVILLGLSLVSCDDDTSSSPSPQVTELPNFVSYNTGLVPVFPEGIEFDTDRASFLVSSSAGLGIRLIDLEGNVTTLVSESIFLGNGTFGLQIDKSNNRLLVVSSSLLDASVAHLFSFNLGNGSMIFDADLSTLSPGLNFVNDVAVDADGNAYVTNSDQGIIFKVDINGNAEIFFQDDSFTPENPAIQIGFNGIDYHEDGFLLVSHYLSDKIYKLEIANPSTLQEVSLPSGFVRGGDGIYLDGNELVVVNNAGVPFVSKFVSNDSWASGTLEGDTYATGDIFPTTVVKVGDDYMVNMSYFNYPLYGVVSPTNYLIAKANFDFSTRYTGSSTEIPRVNTPVMPLGYGDEYPDLFYAGCDTPIGSGIPDLQGEWTEETVVIGGVEFPASSMLYSERIEQCGNRILIANNGVLREVFLDDNTLFNGVNDVNAQGLPVHFRGRFEDNRLVLDPVLLLDSGDSLPEFTRELIQDDSGEVVLQLFNPTLQPSTRYLKRN